MKTNLAVRLIKIVGLSSVLCLGLAVADEPDDGETERRSAPQKPAAEARAKEETAKLSRLSLQAARERAQLMHRIYSATLDTMHERYFHGDRAVVPARAMEDIFFDIERQTHAKSRWISASLPPMSVDHEPKTEFEKQASKRIAKGERVVEAIEDGYYRRAGSISLAGGCVRCHGASFADTSTSSKFAGLIVSIPVDEDARLTDDESGPAR